MEVTRITHLGIGLVCQGCGDVFRGEAIRDDLGHWHPNCFFNQTVLDCKWCDEPIPFDEVYYLGGVPLHWLCAEKAQMIGAEAPDEVEP